jgi:uncharacterized protein
VKIELSTVESEPVSFSHRVALDPSVLDPDQVAETLQVSVEGVVRRRIDGFTVEGSVSCDGNLLCCRCLTGVPWQVDESFAVELRPTSQRPVEEDVELDDGELEVVFCETESLDIDELAAEQVLLALPMKTVCSADCAGLCPSCGGNLNREGECRCEPEGDPRWEALRGLKVGRSAD